MTRFLDGPAADVTLMLHRAPLLLRVARSARGEWDALDQLADEPRADEQIIVYYRVRQAGDVHIDTKKGGGWYPMAEYRVLEQQPQDVYVRRTERWRAWCEGAGRQALQRAAEDAAAKAGSREERA